METHIKPETEVKTCATISEVRPSLSAELTTALAENEKLRAFKTWVHEYLDSHGVPHHPPGTHGAEGCRIGDRMDWLMAQHEKLRSALEFLEKALLNMPDLEITYREDGDEEDSIGIVPQGWNFRCDSVCVEPLTINAPTFEAMIERARAALAAQEPKQNNL